MGREHHREAQFPEKRSPKRIIFIQIQNPGNANLPPGGLGNRQRRIGKHALQLIGRHIGALVLGRGSAQTLFTPVPCDVAAATGKLVGGEHTAVGAAGGGGGVGEIQNLRNGEHGAPLPLVPVPGDERRTEGAHDAGNVGANGLHPSNALKRPQHRLVVEGAALDHHMAAKLPGVGQLDDLIQSIFNDRISKTG